MKKILLLISLFLSLFTSAQQPPIGVIYVSPGGCNLILDQYSGETAAYSLEQIKCGFTGNLIQVRRDSDNATQDIGFDVNGDLDVASISSFVGSNSAYVSAWYNQGSGGTLWDLAQATLGSQPRIVNAGVLETVGGKPAIFFDGTNDFLKSNVAFTCEDFSVFATMNLATVSGVHMIVDADNGGGTRIAQFLRTNGAALESIGFNGGTAYTESNSATLTATTYLFSVMKTASTIEAFVNNSSAGGTAMAVDNNTGTTNLTIGAFAGGAGGFYYSGHSREVIIYQFDNSANRTGISNNINSRYSIY